MWCPGVIVVWASPAIILPLAVLVNAAGKSFPHSPGARLCSRFRSRQKRSDPGCCPECTSLSHAGLRSDLFKFFRIARMLRFVQLVRRADSAVADPSGSVCSAAEVKAFKHVGAFEDLWKPESSAKPQCAKR